MRNADREIRSKDFLILLTSLVIITTLISKIPPNLPLSKGRITPLWQKGRGEIFYWLRQFNFETFSNSEFRIPKSKFSKTQDWQS